MQLLTICGKNSRKILLASLITSGSCHFLNSPEKGPSQVWERSGILYLIRSVFTIIVYQGTGNQFIDILELVGTAVLENGRQVRATGSAVHGVHPIMCCPFC